MKQQKKNNGKGIFLIVLLTLFFISFSTSAWIIINSNKLVFVDDIEEYKNITEGLKSNEDKEQKIIDLTEQVERYKNMYESLSDENKGLIRTNQSLNAKISELENKANNRTSTDKDKSDDNSEDKDDKKETTTDKKTDSKNTSTNKNTTNKNKETTKDTSTSKKE